MTYDYLDLIHCVSNNHFDISEKEYFDLMEEWVQSMKDDFSYIDLIKDDDDDNI